MKINKTFTAKNTSKKDKCAFIKEASDRKAKRQLKRIAGGL